MVSGKVVLRTGAAPAAEQMGWIGVGEQACVHGHRGSHGAECSAVGAVTLTHGVGVVAYCSAMGRLWLSALGADRPGIVAAVSGVLVELGCNLEDSTMTNLQGHFAVMLVVAAPEGVTAGALEEALVAVAGRFELVVVVRPLGDAPAPGQVPGAPTESWTIAVHGADRPGIVRDVTSALAAAGGNVVDLSTHLVGGTDAPVYVMTLWVTLAAGEAGEAAAEAIRQAAAALDVHCSVHRDEVDLL
jgi:glycine cleavage system transcriptional repressor